MAKFNIDPFAGRDLEHEEESGDGEEQTFDGPVDEPEVQEETFRRAIEVLKNEIRTALAYSHLLKAEQIRDITNDLAGRLTCCQLYITMGPPSYDGSWYAFDGYNRSPDPEAEKTLKEIELLDQAATTSRK